MQIHQMTAKTSRTRAKTIGRGGKRGKTSGRGTKGQKARSGHKIRPEYRDLIKKLPKNRGYRFQSIETKPALVQVGSLERFDAKTEITPAFLREQGLVRGNGRNLPEVKILATGSLTKALVISGCSLSASARSKIEAAGGSVKS